MNIRSFLLTLAAVLVVGLIIVANIHRPSSAIANDNADALRQLEADLMKSAAEHGAQGYLAYYADDAVELPNDAPLIQGKVKIARSMSFLDNKQNHLSWTPVGADMSSSGDLGYTYGNFQFSAVDKDGKSITEYGKYTSIWKKQADGSWKVVLDMGNSHPSPRS